jgi:hypothetical protein
MKKLIPCLLITIFISPFLQAEETKEKRNICSAYAKEIYNHGIYPCKKGDIFQQLDYDRNHPAANMHFMLKVCELETISGRNCILMAEKDFNHTVYHSTYLRDKKIVKEK